MTTNSQSGVRPMTAGQFKAISRAVTDKIPTKISFDEAEELIKRVGRATEEMFMDLRIEIGQEQTDEMVREMIEYELMVLRSSWTSFYQKLGFAFDPSALWNHKPDDGRNYRLLGICRQMPNDALYDFGKNQVFDGKCWSWYEKNKISHNTIKDKVDGRATRPGTDYFVWVLDTEDSEPLEDLASKSANYIKDLGIRTETWFERLLHSIRYFQETKENTGIGQLLDRRNWTLCADSRDLHGSVPGVGVDGDKVGVDCSPPSYRGSSLSARAVPR